MNLTYLLGAGASAEVLPVVTKIPGRLDFFRNEIHNFKFNEPFELDIGKKLRITPTNLCDELKKTVNNLLEEIEKHATIDTLAKRYLITEELEKLKELKAAFSSFLLFEQALNGYDRRYDTFLASIIVHNSMI